MTNMTDLARLTTFRIPAKPRYFVRSVGSEIGSTVHNTWASTVAAETYAEGMQELNPMTEFEIVDLETGVVLP